MKEMKDKIMHLSKIMKIKNKNDIYNQMYKKKKKPIFDKLLNINKLC